MDSQPIPPQNGQYPNYPGYPYPQGYGDMGGRRAKFARYVLRYWWMVVLTTSAGLCLAAFQTLRQPADYVSQASLWVSGKVKLPENNLYSEELQFFFGTQIELLKSDTLQERTLRRAATLKPELRPRARTTP